MEVCVPGCLAKAGCQIGHAQRGLASTCTGAPDAPSFAPSLPTGRCDFAVERFVWLTPCGPAQPIQVTGPDAASCMEHTGTPAIGRKTFGQPFIGTMTAFGLHVCILHGCLFSGAVSSLLGAVAPATRPRSSFECGFCILPGPQDLPWSSAECVVQVQ